MFLKMFQKFIICYLNRFQNPSKMLPKSGTENNPVFYHFLVAFWLPKWSQKCSKIGVKKHHGPQGAPRELPRVAKEPPSVQKGPPWEPQGLHFGQFWLNFDAFGTIFGTSLCNFNIILIPSGIPPAQNSENICRQVVYGFELGVLCFGLWVWTCRCSHGKGWRDSRRD